MKYLLCSVIILCASCTSVKKKVFQYQTEHAGKNYHYVHKPSEKSGQKTLTSVAFSGFNTSHYFDPESSDHNEFSVTHVSREDNSFIGYNLYYFQGQRTIKNTIFEEEINDTFDYLGYGFRLDFSTSVGSKDASFRILNLQVGLNYEDGEYYDWRRMMMNKYEDFKNLGRSNYTMSVYYVPELTIHSTKDIDFGIFGGYGAYFNHQRSKASSVFGLSARFQTVGVSFVMSDMEYEHIFYVGLNRENEKDVIVNKVQRRFTISVFF